VGKETQRLMRKWNNAWQRVTNELVMQFALKDCEKCEGKGMFTVSDKDNTRRVAAMCDCVDAPFKKEYAGRLRRTKEGRLEFKPLAEATSLDD
jgi:hypothetical protein